MWFMNGRLLGVGLLENIKEAKIRIEERNMAALEVRERGVRKWAENELVEITGS